MFPLRQNEIQVQFCKSIQLKKRKKKKRRKKSHTKEIASFYAIFLYFILFYQKTIGESYQNPSSSSSVISSLINISIFDICCYTCDILNITINVTVTFSCIYVSSGIKNTRGLMQNPQYRQVPLYGCYRKTWTYIQCSAPGARTRYGLQIQIKQNR